MDPDTAFLICNAVVMPAWLLLALAPSWSLTERLVHSAWIPAMLGLAYLAAFALNPESPEGAGFGSLNGVMQLFTSPYAVLAGWIHYLAFDLFLGAWEVRDAKRRGLPHVYVLPSLFFTLMLGPAGFLSYLVLRFVRTGVATFDEAVSP